MHLIRTTLRRLDRHVHVTRDSLRPRTIRKLRLELQQAAALSLDRVPSRQATGEHAEREGHEREFPPGWILHGTSGTAARRSSSIAKDSKTARPRTPRIPPSS